MQRSHKNVFKKDKGNTLIKKEKDAVLKTES